mmetsp:Transcript_138933/g.346355  ORF Transcript_138933/g.346355 Transcript_138933/m.346355 type:complete len:213 (-) Transcript_138933:1918-2556(-)
MLASGEALRLVSAVSQQMTNCSLQQVTTDDHALLGLVATHRLHETAVSVEVLDPIPLHDQGHAARVHCMAAMHGSLLGVVLRKGVVHARGLDGNSQVACQGPYHKGDATAQGMPCNHHLPVLWNLAHMLQDLLVVPPVVLHVQALQDDMDAADNHGGRVPRPEAHGWEHEGQDLKRARLSPHPEVFSVVHDPSRICPRDCDDGDQVAIVATG